MVVEVISFFSLKEIDLKNVLILCALILTSCITHRHVGYDAGREMYALSCNGNFQTFANCFEKAAQVCQGSYIVKDKSETYFTYNGQLGIKRELIVVCK